MITETALKASQLSYIKIENYGEPSVTYIISKFKSCYYK